MRYKMLIDGQLAVGVSSIGVENPATGTVFEQCPIADEALLNRAVAAAKAAFPAWSSLSYAERGKRLDKFADALEKNAGDMAQLLTREQGKPNRKLACRSRFCDSRRRRICPTKPCETPPTSTSWRHARRLEWWRPSHRGIIRSC